MSNFIPLSSKSELGHLKHIMSKEAYTSLLDLQKHQETMETESKTSKVFTAVTPKLNDGSARSSSSSDWSDYNIDSEGSSSPETKPASVSQKSKAAKTVYRNDATSSEAHAILADLESYNQKAESEEKTSSGSNSPVSSQENLTPPDTTVNDLLKTSKAKAKELFATFTTSSKAALEKILK